MNELSRRYLYIDESGTPYLNDKRCSFFVLIGISISGFSNSYPIYYLDDIFRKHNINYKQNFHAVDLFEPVRNNKGNIHPAYIKSDKEAKDLVLEIANFIKNFPLNVSAYLIRKKSFLGALNLTKNKIEKSSLSKYTRKEINFLPYSYAITRLVHNFAAHNKFLDKEKLGSIIFETRPENELIVNNLEKIRFQSNFEDERVKNKAKKMNENIVSIEFANKNSCYPGLAIADMIGFALHQRYARRVTQFENRGMKELLKAIDKNSSIGVNQLRISKEIKKYLTKETLNKISKI